MIGATVQNRTRRSDLNAKVITMSQLNPSEQSPCAPLPKHKMSVLAFLGLLLPVYFIPTALTRVLPDHPGLIKLVAVGIIVPLMSYLVMPVLTRVFRGWIAPKA